MKEPLSNIGAVCEDCASKPGKYTGQDPKTFVGKHVKLGFPARDPRTMKKTTEHMWVEVQEVTPEGLKGTVNNDPIMVTQYICGTEILFTVDEIEDVYVTKATDGHNRNS